MTQIRAPDLVEPLGISVQFRYAFVVESRVRRYWMRQPLIIVASSPGRSCDSSMPACIVARRYAYVAAGKDGIAIIDVEKSEQPNLDHMFGWRPVSHVNDVKIGMVDASALAFVADGKTDCALATGFARGSPTAHGFSPS